MSVRVHFEGPDGPESEVYDSAIIQDGGVLVCIRTNDDGTPIKRHYAPNVWLETFEVINDDETTERVVNTHEWHTTEEAIDE